MPTVVVRMLEGRNLDQKRALVKRITEALIEECNAKDDRVSVYIEEFKTENLAHAGVLFVDKK